MRYNIKYFKDKVMVFQNTVKATDLCQALNKSENNASKLGITINRNELWMSVKTK